MSDIKSRRPREPGRLEAIASEVAPSIIIGGTSTSIAAPVAAESDSPAPVALPSLIMPEAPPARAKIIAPSMPLPAAASQEIPRAIPAKNAWRAVLEAQTALARGCEEIFAEFTGLATTGMAISADAAIAMLGARSFADAADINAGLTRRSLDAVIAKSARLSEIGIKTVGEASRPLRPLLSNREMPR